MEIDFSKFQRGRGFFKFNTSLLKEPEYVILINETIRETASRYAEDIYDTDFLKIATPEQLQELSYTINPQLLLETLLLEIRGKTIEYSARLKKSKNEAQKLAIHRLEVLETTSDSEPLNHALKVELERAKKIVEDFIKIDNEGAQCRARTKWRVEGEKPSKFFCNLEKYNALQKYIPELKVKDKDNKDIIIKEQSKIDKELYKFYQDLYRSQESTQGPKTIEQFLEKGNAASQDSLAVFPKLSESEALKLEGLISVDEATKYMKICRGDASPGSSGFTGNFYKFFWRNLKNFIVDSLNFAYESGNLSLSQKLGIIILLPKPNKDKKLLSNWRPISLLNHIYKILSGALAERIKPMLPNIIHNDQKGFVRGRFMGECIRNTYDVIEYAKNNNKVGLLLLIDFEKAFDSISHSFIIKSLRFFGFGFSFIKWINLLLNDTSSCINHCGNVTDRFSVGRSCPQGDPISPYLFILCVEVLALKIRKSSQVKGFKLGNVHHKIDIYADDLTAYLDGSESSLRGIINILDEFQAISGLKINLSKCKAVWIGRNRGFNVKVCEDLKLIWAHNFTLLGIELDSDLAKMDTNFRKKYDDIKALYNNWLYRHLSPLGRITVIKSIALSKLSSVVVCPHIAPTVLKDLINLSFKFLWKNKPDRMKRVDAMLPIDKGGLNMPDIGVFWDSLKISWARRLMNSDCFWQKVLQLNILSAGFETEDLLYAGPKLLKKLGNALSNPFWSETVLAFTKICESVPYAHPHLFFHLNFFHNEIFSSRGMYLNKQDFPELWRKGVSQVGDLYDCTLNPPKMLSLQNLRDKYNLRLNFLQYLRIKTIIDKGAKGLNYKIYNENLSDLQYPRLPLLYKLGCAQTKGCSPFYKTLRARELDRMSMSVSEQKWEKELGLTFSTNFWDKIWKIDKKSLVENKMKWISIQINRHILPTNYTVNKYDRNVDPGCSLCSNSHLEKLSFLLWGCQVVQDFWHMITNILTFHFPGFKLGIKEAIFGDINSNGDSVQNTILLLSRQFIWRQKFTCKSLDEDKFITFIRQELKTLLNVHLYKGKLPIFINDWQAILDHFEVVAL